MKNAAATTILAQLGGSRFVAMTGANNLVADATHLGLRFKGFRKANHLKVILDANDTYRLVFGKIKGWDYSVTAEIAGVYAENLRGAFEGHTGLATSL